MYMGSENYRNYRKCLILFPLPPAELSRNSRKNYRNYRRICEGFGARDP